MKNYRMAVNFWNSHKLVQLVSSLVEIPSADRESFAAPSVTANDEVESQRNMDSPASDSRGGP